MKTKKNTRPLTQAQVVALWRKFVQMLERPDGMSAKQLREFVDKFQYTNHYSNLVVFLAHHRVVLEYPNKKERSPHYVIYNQKGGSGELALCPSRISKKAKWRIRIKPLRPTVKEIFDAIEKMMMDEKYLINQKGLHLFRGVKVSGLDMSVHDFAEAALKAFSPLIKKVAEAKK